LESSSIVDLIHLIPFKKLIFILAPFVLLIVVLIASSILFSPVAKTEGVWIDTPLQEKAYANLYYPKNPHMSHPVVIYFHGLTQQNDIDLRWPLELTKRGFYVLCVDQSGHGRTYGIHPGLQDDVLKPFFFENVKGVVDYIYSRQDLFNASAIGCMGHSLGGWTTLMGTVIEPRINASVSLAGPTNITSLGVDFSGLFKNIGVTPENDFITNPDLQKNHSVVEYYNGTYGVNPPKNLLLIQGRYDTTVNVNQAISAYNLVNDPSKCDLLIIDGAGADHALINDTVVYATIAWFETKLLGGIQAPLNYDQFTYVPFYAGYILILLGIYSSVFGFSFFLFKIKESYFKSTEKKPTASTYLDEKSYGSAIINLLLYSIPILSIWIFLFYVQNIVFNYLETLLIGAVLFIALETLSFYLKSRESFHLKSIKNTIKSNINLSGILIAIICAIYFLGFYYVVAYHFKFLVFGPRSIPLYFLSILGIFPFILSYEIFLRKIIQDRFPLRRERNKWINRILLFGFSIIAFSPLNYIISGAFISMLVVLIFAIAVTTINIYLYEKTKSVLATTVFSTLVVGFFIAQCYFLFI
jgi:dienelactone hydrolase